MLLDRSVSKRFHRQRRRKLRNTISLLGNIENRYNLGDAHGSCRVDNKQQTEEGQSKSSTHVVDLVFV